MRIRFTIRTLAMITILVALALAAVVRLEANRREFVKSVSIMDETFESKLISDAGLPDTRYITETTVSRQPKVEALPSSWFDTILMRRNCRVSFETCRRSGMMFYFFHNTSDYRVSLFDTEYVSSTEQKGMTVGM